MKEYFFTDLIWELIHDFLGIWHTAYNTVMLELPKRREKRYTVHLSATKKIRFTKDLHHHHFIGKTTPPYWTAAGWVQHPPYIAIYQINQKKY